MDDVQSSVDESQIESKAFVVDQVRLASSRATSSNPTAAVVQPVPMLQRVQVSPVLVQSASSAFQTSTPGSGAQTTCASSIASTSNSTSNCSSNPTTAATASAKSSGDTAAAANPAGNTVLIQQPTPQPVLTLPPVSSMHSASAETTMASVAVPAGAAMTTLPNGQYFFMMPNSIPTIAPRPPLSSEAMTSPPVVTAAVRADGSPVAFVPTSPLDGDSSPGLPPLKRPRSGSPRETKRRAIHNEVERRRRDRINHFMEQLKEIVPSSPMGCSHNSKGHVLEKAVLHINELKGQIDALQEQLAGVQHRYNVEHDQVIQCASQHTLLRQQLLDSTLKPAFGLFKIAGPAMGNGGMVEKSAGGLVKVSVPAGVITTHTTSILPSSFPTAAAATAAAVNASAAQLANCSPLPLVTGAAESQPSSPPALTIVALGTPLQSQLPQQ